MHIITNLNNIVTQSIHTQYTDEVIKSKYEANSNTNAYTDAEKSKLAEIESGATADQTKADIDALNINADTLDGQHGSYYTSYTDTAIANLVGSSPEALDTLYELAAALGEDPNFATTVSNQLGTKVDKVVGKGLSTEDYTTSEKTKLAGIESGATGDQTAAEIRALVEAATDSNVFTDADHDKLNGIAAGAQVNVATNLNYVAATRVLTSSTGDSVTLPQVTTSADGLMAASDKSKLDDIEANAKDDQIASEVPVTTSGNLTATNVQLALQELQSNIDSFTTSIEW